MNKNHSLVRWLYCGSNIMSVLFSAAVIFPAVCSAQESLQAMSDAGSKAGISVDIVGFNYTDRVIDSFSVNEQGGGNVFLSTITSGGGKSVCCIRLPDAVRGLSKIRVRWQVDGCIYLTKSRISEEIFKNIFPYYKQAEIELNRPQESKLQHLEIHFYPDGSVKGKLTAELSLPQLSLDSKRRDKSNFQRCRDDKKPE